MVKEKKEKPRGILNPEKGRQKFNLKRFIPSEDVSFFVEHFWIVEWDLRGKEPYASETLPHPCIHVVFENGKADVVGIMDKRFTRVLKDKGIVFGIKFKPGGFYPFVRTPVTLFVNKLINLEAILGKETCSVSNTILNLRSYTEMSEAAESFLRNILPEPDENITVINKIVEHVIKDRGIIKVEDIVGRFGINKRALQRLFNVYLGVNPKWIIKRYRLHEAAEQLAISEERNYSALALDLGYFDQAHFIKDFKAVIGKSPEEYAKLNSLSLDTIKKNFMKS